MLNLAPMGHNNPPTESEILQQRLDGYETEAKFYQQLASRVIPDEIQDDKEAGQITDYIGAVKSFNKTIEGIHKKEKQPFLDAGRVADAWKNKYGEKTSTLLSKAEMPLLKWNKKKEQAERERQLEVARVAREQAGALAAEALAHANEGIDDTAQELIEAAVEEEQKADMILNSALHVKAKSRGVFSSSGIRRDWTGEIESMAAIDLEALRQYFKEEDVLSALSRAVKDGVRELRGAKIFEKEKLTTR